MRKEEIEIESGVSSRAVMITIRGLINLGIRRLYLTVADKYKSVAVVHHFCDSDAPLERERAILYRLRELVPHARARAREFIAAP